MSNKLNILIVDDDQGMIDVLKPFLKDHHVVGFTKSIEAIEAAKKQKYDFLIVDYYVDELDGSKIVKRIREFDKEIYILLLTGFAESVPGIQSLNEMDIQSYVEKTNMKDVTIHIQSAIKSIQFMKDCYKEEDVNFGSRLKELRKKFNVSQEDLARYLNVGRTTIANYERSFNMPSVDILEKLARYFGVSIDYLLCYTVGSPDVLKEK